MAPLLAVFGPAVFASAPVVQATCAALSPTAKEGLRTLIRENHGPADRPNCGLTFVYAHRAVVMDGKVALPCLLDLYHNGLTNNPDLWSGPGSPPSSSPWTLPIIRWIDPAAARLLFEALRERATDPLARVRLDAELALMGERVRLPELVAFLARPSGSSDVRYTQVRILMAISKNDYRPAREVVRAHRDQLPDPHVVDVYLAQLDRDLGGLQNRLADPTTSQAAALALLWMGEEELLEAVAEDRAHPAQAMAAAVVAGEIRP